ncbi:uncharacterized protein LOC114381587 [Glycine soja]|uniref:uncharacterized protein n=1 Tax=Glycine max TaxID=3847 RepID=UPI0003DEAA23|nr:uncharacterized protein LOC102664406 [Glycine max]XP_028196653.1 uncharacterized protein LOC114381587 [Glycine soja]|eukprot:XP_006595267.1 uncharacterized protein LOC102664406 [Glycine max]
MPILKGKNYDNWCAQMKVIFRFQDVTEVVKEGVQELDRNPTDTQKVAHRDLMKRDAKALFIIHQCVDADNFQKIRSVDTAKKAWDTLEKSYAGDNKLKKVKLQTLIRQYELLQMSDQESISEFFSRILEITNQMNAYGDKQSDLGIIDKVLRTLTPRFDHIVVVIEQGQNLEEMKIEELQGILEAQEMRLNERNSQRSVEQAMQAQTTKGHNYDGGKNKKERESGRTISGRGQVKAPAILKIITRMKKQIRKVEGITKWARRNSTRKGFSVITVTNGDILQMNAKVKGFQEMQMRLNWHKMKILTLIRCY